MEREDYGESLGDSFGTGQPADTASKAAEWDKRRLENIGEKADRVTDEVVDKAQRLKDRASTVVESAKEQVSATYDQTQDFLGRSCERVLEFGRRKPGTAILLGFGAGVLASMALTGDRRNRRLLPAVAAALAAALDVFADRF